MKKLILIISLSALASTTFANETEKLVYTFNKTFPSAQNIRWSEDSQGYFVSFTQFGITSKVAYDPQGSFQYALRYYSEENLPLSILMILRQRFADRKIFGITELSTSDNITYHVKMEDAKNWYSIKVTSSGNVSTEEHFKKRDL